MRRLDLVPGEVHEQPLHPAATGLAGSQDVRQRPDGEHHDGPDAYEQEQQVCVRTEELLLDDQADAKAKRYPTPRCSADEQHDTATEDEQDAAPTEDAERRQIGRDEPAATADASAHARADRARSAAERQRRRHRDDQQAIEPSWLSCRCS